MPLLLFSTTPIWGYLAGGGVWYWLTVFVLLLSIALDPIVGADPVNAPRLPYGYLNILFVVMVPSAWRKLMHPIIEEFYDTADIIPYALPNTLPERFVERAVITDIE
jgi:hypothetical protein